MLTDDGLQCCLIGEIRRLMRVGHLMSERSKFDVL